MANIATCPKCAKQLGLPLGIALADRVECPECQAVFALIETVQISLPQARLLDATEASPKVADIATDELPLALESEVAKTEPTTVATPKRNWEERLKKALAKDCSDEGPASADLAPTDLAQTDSEPAEEVAVETTDSTAVEPSAANASPLPPANFEMELDLKSPVDDKSDPTEFVTNEPVSFLSELSKANPKQPPQQTRAPAKTLADFAAAADIPALDLDPPSNESTESPSAQDAAGTAKSAPEMTVEEFFAQDVDEHVDEHYVAPPEVRTFEDPQMIRSRLPKLAALVGGPVIGSVLGLYGLLWLQGDKADYLGLAQVLPASILPADFGSTAASEEDGPSQERSALLAARELKNEPPDRSVVAKLDAAVTPASAAEPLPPAPNARITIDEYVALVDAAKNAIPDFLAGDLKTSESVRRKGQAYMAFCRLAENFDFAYQPGLAPSVQDKIREARQLFQEVTSQANYRQELSHIASRWWEYAQRPTPGIFLAGQVEKTQPFGEGTLCWVKLSGKSTLEPIPVLFKIVRYQIGDPIGVVGRVTANPSEILAGFSGQQLVLAEFGFRL